MVAVFVFAGTASAKVPGTPASTLKELMSQVALGPASSPPSQTHFGVGITECPHAGEPSDKSPKPLDRREPDKVEQLSNGGDDVKVNQDYFCMPQNETAIAVNPTNPKNVLAGQNDYRLGWGSTGFDASTDNGNHWYDGIRSFPTGGTPLLSPVLLSDDHIDGGGDPAPVFDREGVVYLADIHFERERDDNGIFVSRSTNGGFTWSRPCVVRTRDLPPFGSGGCGGPGDPRKAGDGVVVFEEDPDGTGPAPSAAFHDKEYIAAGPRPAGVTPQCFDAAHNVTACPAGTVGVDRIYVTWTRFDNINLLSATIQISFSDDRARSWSPQKTISGSASFCAISVPTPGQCNLNQFSSPTVNPTTGFLYVGFENFNTPDENQYLVVRSMDGSATFQGPFFATIIFDVNYPNAGGNRSADCGPRGAQPRNVLTNSCFRMFSAANMVVDKRGGAFADDLYMVLSDNRNGTPAKSNTDVFFFKSTDGGTTWIGPTRVNDDPSTLVGSRDDPDNIQVTGNDNFYPWTDVSLKGDVNVGFHDRRLDTQSTLHEWPASRQFTGNYLAWFWGAICSITTTADVTPADVGKTTSQLPAAARQCLAPGAQVIFVPNVAPLLNPQNPGSGAVPGQGPTFLGPFKNFTLSDVGSNMDYTFRAGIFMGDYNNLAIGPDGTAYAFWTDGRNGRSSRNQVGRNPACEQGDVFLDSYSSNMGGQKTQNPSLDVINAFSVTPCPTDMQEP
jgi:hypothetical protein